MTIIMKIHLQSGCGLTPLSMSKSGILLQPIVQRLVLPGQDMDIELSCGLMSPLTLSERRPLACVEQLPNLSLLDIHAKLVTVLRHLEP